MTEKLEAVVTEQRRSLLGLAYRLLGSITDAEDVVQEAFVRLERHGLDGIERPGAWLNRTVSRLCLDRLRAARTRREVYVGPWLPEPVPGDATAATSTSPEGTIELAESVSLAFLVVLESLSPAERVAFVLRDVFGYDHAELAAILDRSEEACRQLVSRARASVRDRRPRFEADPEVRAAVADRFLEAAGSGRVEALLEVLAPDVVLVSDGGGKVSAARRPVAGAERVARFFAGLVAQAPPGFSAERRVFNGTPGAVVLQPDRTVDMVIVPEVADGMVVAVHAVRNPDKLAHLRTRA